MTGDSGGFPGYTVRDRRWWVHPDERAEQRQESEPVSAEPAVPPRQPGSLEAELADRDRRVREALARERQAVLELDQARARLERDARKEIERARRDLVLELVPVLDDLDRAIAAARAAGQGGALLTGVELVRSGFLDRLRAAGVERFDAHEERFDPTRHEAVSAVETTDPLRVGFVVGVLRPGYAIAGETIRPAQVIVGRSPVQTTGGW